MANPYAGEVAIVLDGVVHSAKLTLGALAELEAAMAAGSLVEMVERFESGKVSTRDVLALIELVRTRAREARGVELETEVEIVGED